MNQLRIAIADDEPRVCQFLEESLGALGHQVVCVANTGQDLVRQCHNTRPDLVVTDIKMPDMDGIDAAVALSEQEPIPIILVSAHIDDELLDRAVQHHVLAYLVKPIKPADLAPAIRIAMRRFEEFQLLNQETSDLKQALADRKVIERAKGVLMDWTGMKEHDAFVRLQKLSKDKNRKLVEIARMIVTVNTESTVK
jgi:response regulator NasT